MPRATKAEIRALLGAATKAVLARDYAHADALFAMLRERTGVPYSYVRREGGTSA